jgi:signal transduction histidine kinase
MPRVNLRAAGVFGRAVEPRHGRCAEPGVESIHPRVDPGGADGVHPCVGDGEAFRPYSFLVSSKARSLPHPTEVEGAPVDAATYRWMRPLAVVAIGFVVTGAFQTHPGPGAQGQHLAVSVALIVFAVATIGVVRLPDAAPKLQLPLLIIAVASAVTLVGLQPTAPGFLGVFPAVSAAALRLPARSGAVVAGIAIAALAVAWALFGHHPVAGVVLNEFGVAAFYLLATFARRYREANEQSQRLIVELEQTRAAQAQAAALAERQRLAREMHDVLAHLLSGLVLNLEGARLIAERGDADPKVAEAIGRAHRLAKTGLEEARRAIGMLRDDALPGPRRLAELAAEFEGDSGIACTFAVSGDEHDIGSDGSLTFYRVAQEALTNIRKHAYPDRVEVRLAYEPADARLTIEDFETDNRRPPPGDGTGYGLTGMRERAELLGGTLTAGPTADGFRVDLWVPA